MPREISMPTPDAPGETLHRLLHAYRRAMRDDYAAADITATVSHIRVLKHIAGEADISARDIADRMGIDKARIARLIQDLEARGLIQRHPHAGDARRRTLVLTPAGRTMRERIRGAETRAGARMAGQLTEAELVEFTRLAETLIVNLENSPHAESI